MTHDRNPWYNKDTGFFWSGSLRALPYKHHQKESYSWLVIVHKNKEEREILSIFAATSREAAILAMRGFEKFIIDNKKTQKLLRTSGKDNYNVSKKKKVPKEKKEKS